MRLHLNRYLLVLLIIIKNVNVKMCKGMLLFMSALMLCACNSNKSTVKEVTTYYELTKEQRQINGKVIKETYQVQKAGNLKNGYYKKYDLNQTLLEKGNFSNGRKIGIWEIWNHEDQIWIHKDFSNEGEEKAIVVKEYLKYPFDIIEERDTLPIGQIILGLQFNDACNLIHSKIVNGIDQVFDQEILERYRRYVQLCNKYHLEVAECVNEEEQLSITFAN